MQRVSTQGIVLSRTNFGEADRIITFLTPDNGKVSGLVRGVRKTKSKLAGGIELFSVSDISYIVGRGEVHTVISTRLIKHYADIVKDLDRTNTAYELIKMLNKATEDQPEAAYFELLREAFEGLDNSKVDLDLINVWFRAQLLRLEGHTPNLLTDAQGGKLQENQKYSFNFDKMNFQPANSGRNLFDSNKIKFLRLLFGGSRLEVLAKIQNANNLSSRLRPFLESLLLS